VTDPAFEVVVVVVSIIIVGICVVQDDIIFEAAVTFVNELRHVRGVSFVIRCVGGWEAATQMKLNGWAFARLHVKIRL